MSQPIPDAIAICKSASNAETSDRAYVCILDAVGNNHAETYSQSALPMLDALEAILAQAGPWSQRAALEAVIDLYGSFEPDCAPAESGQLVEALSKRVTALEPLISEIAARDSVASDSAQDLLLLLRGTAA